MYSQCVLKRTREGDRFLSETVTYIPKNLAKVGKFVELKEDKKWVTWQITNVSSTSISDEEGKKLHKRWHKGWNNNI